jgi:hypothetical protein
MGPLTQPKLAIVTNLILYTLYPGSSIRASITITHPECSPFEHTRPTIPTENDLTLITKAITLPWPARKGLLNSLSTEIQVTFEKILFNNSSSIS